MNEIIKKVEQWAIDRKLHVADSKGQALKVVEEFTEMLIACEVYKPKEEVVDGVGDTYVTLIILCKQLGLDFEELMFLSNHSNFIEDHAQISNLYIYVSLNKLSTGVSKNDVDKIEMAIISLIGAIDVIANIVKASPEDCLQAAYNEIKDRTGKTVNGTFIKSEDLQ